MVQRLAITLVSVLWTNLAVATTPGIVDRALVIQFNQLGLDTIAKELEVATLSSIEKAPLPNQEIEIEAGIKALIESAWISLSFDNVSVRARSDVLVISAGIKDAVIHADQITLKKKVLGTTIRTTCADTDILIGQNQSQTLSITLQPLVENGYVGAKTLDVQFSIAEQEYKIKGPGSCEGELGTGEIIKRMVRKSLERAKRRIEKSVKDQAIKAVSSLLEILNENARQSIELDLSGTPYFPSQGVVIETAPFAVTTADDDLSLIMSIVASTPTANVKLASPSPQAHLPTKIGSIGLNPRVIEEVLTTAFPNGSDWIELSEANAPGLKEILRISSASAIWPDLLEAASASDYLRLQIKLDRMPEVRAGQGREHVVTTIPSFSMKFQINQDGQWIDYYLFKTTIRAAAELAIGQRGLSISMASRPALAISGEWAESYVPQVPDVEIDMAEALLRSVLDFVYYGGPIVSTQLPTLRLTTYELTLSNPSASGELVQLQINRSLP